MVFVGVSTCPNNSSKQFVQIIRPNNLPKQTQSIILLTLFTNKVKLTHTMHLSDTDIKKALISGDIIIKDFDPNRLQPASYDILLGDEFIVFDNHKSDCIDPKENPEKYTRKIKLQGDDSYFVLHPSEFALGVTFDYFGVSQKYACQIMGKSSLARLGLIIHTTAGFVDPGNQLKATLEFVNVNTLPIRLYPKMKIAQIAFYELKSPATKGYGHPDLNSKYHMSKTVEKSQMWKNFSK